QPEIRRHDARRHRQLRDPRHAPRHPLEAFAEPQPPRAGADRRGAGEIRRFGRALARRAAAQALAAGVRLFFALWPPPDAARALGEWAREVQARSGGRATRDETIHLTLAFLGDGDVSKASAAGRAVKAQAFEFPLEQARYWPHNHVVWIGPRETPP